MIASVEIYKFHAEIDIVNSIHVHQLGFVSLLSFAAENRRQNNLAKKNFDERNWDAAESCFLAPVFLSMLIFSSRRASAVLIPALGLERSEFMRLPCVLFSLQRDLEVHGGLMKSD